MEIWPKSWRSFGTPFIAKGCVDVSVELLTSSLEYQMRRMGSLRKTGMIPNTEASGKVGRTMLQACHNIR